MKKYHLSFFAIIFTCFVALANNPLKSKIESTIDQYLAHRFFNGVYMFADDKEVLAMGAKGVHTVPEKDLVATEIMPVASGTKTITAISILKLQDKGLLSVHDKVSKHLGKKSGIWREGVPAWANKVTIHHLLTHTSGLTEYFMNVELDVTKDHVDINRDIANFAASKEISFAPGSRYEYVNTNYILLGLIIEQVSGKKLGEFFSEEIFTPLGMSDTRLISLEEAVKCQTCPDEHPMPHRYFVTPTGDKPLFNEAKSKHLMVPYSDGGVVSSTRDLIALHKAIHNGKILSDKAYKLMLTKHFEATDRTGVKNYIGYGLFIAELANGDIVYHHAGNAVAIRSEAGYMPSKKLYFAILSNVMAYIPEEMKDKIDMSKPENQLDIHYFLQAIFKAVE